MCSESWSSRAPGAVLICVKNYGLREIFPVRTEKRGDTDSTRSRAATALAEWPAHPDADMLRGMLPRPRVARRLAAVLILGAALSAAGCEHTSVSTGVAVHSSPWGWGNSFSVGIHNHHYRRPPPAQYRRPRRY